jgi:hypothetical protein
MNAGHLHTQRAKGNSGMAASAASMTSLYAHLVGMNLLPLNTWVPLECIISVCLLPATRQQIYLVQKWMCWLFCLCKPIKSIRNHDVSASFSLCFKLLEHISRAFHSKIDCKLTGTIVSIAIQMQLCHHVHIPVAM